MTDPTTQITFVQYVDGSLLQITKMLSKVSEVASSLEAELVRLNKQNEALKAENIILAASIDKPGKVPEKAPKKK